MDIGSKCGYPASSLSNFSPPPIRDRWSRMFQYGRVFAKPQIFFYRYAKACLYISRTSSKEKRS